MWATVCLSVCLSVAWITTSICWLGYTSLSLFPSSCKQDLVISVTPYIGDPDLFISLRPNTHPTQTNYTWVKASVGADVFTLQASKSSHNNAMGSMHNRRSVLVVFPMCINCLLKSKLYHACLPLYLYLQTSSLLFQFLPFPLPSYHSCPSYCVDP